MASSWTEYEEGGVITFDKKFLPEISKRGRLNKQCRDLGVSIDRCTPTTVEEILENKRKQKEAAEKLALKKSIETQF